MNDKANDRVEREIVIRAPIARVFAALTDASLFPTWGPERIEGKVAPGERPIFDFGPAGGGKVTVYIAAFEPPRYFAYRWAQGATDPKILLADPREGPNTLVEFFVEEVANGTRVRVVESGLLALPGIPGVDPDTMREQMGKGWQLMLGGLARHFTAPDVGVKDRIENEIIVRAPVDRVYEALLQPDRWWAEKIDGKVEPGELPILDFGQFGKIRIYVVAAESPRYFAYRSVQGVDDPARKLDDPRKSPSTLVEFRLEPVAEGTRVRQSESGFDALPGDVTVHFKRSNQGWGIVLGMLEVYFAPR